MYHIITNDETFAAFEKELRAFLADAQLDLDFVIHDYNAEEIRILMTLQTIPQFPKVFKLPNLLNYNLQIEGSEIYNVSGDYAEWFLTIPNTRSS